METPQAIYRLLRSANASTSCEPFAGHVLACIFAAAVDECQAGGSFTGALGLCGSALRGNVARYFPGALAELEVFGLDAELVVSSKERQLRELLWRSRTTASPLNSLLTFLVSRRAMRSNHLWQDLGLANGCELSMLMIRYFSSLASGNVHPVKWKQFFDSLIGEEFNIRSRPPALEPQERTACIGQESGMSLLEHRPDRHHAASASFARSFEVLAGGNTVEHAARTNKAKTKTRF
jgi:nitrogen fixation protein NifQ